MPKETALILAGAVAKGAFEAGTLQVLAEHARDLNITRIVGASSGALNASVFATGIRMRAEREVAGNLVRLWQDSGTWRNALDFDLRDFLMGKGLGTGDRVLGLMREAVAGLVSDQKQPVDLQIVLTALAGVDGDIGGEVATTFESVVRFTDEAFDDERQRDRVFATALASGAFPVVFAPVDVPSIGQCADGGAVNNTPVKRVIDGTAVERVIVVTPQPLRAAPAGDLSGMSLISRFAEILVNERLYRDLHDAESINGYLAKLDQLQNDGVSSDVLAKVKGVFGWRRLEIVQIRPEQALEGGAFSAFSDAHLRADYIQAGRDTAGRALAQLLGGQT